MAIPSDATLIEWIQTGGYDRERAAAIMMEANLGFVYKLRKTLHVDQEVALDCFIDALADVVEQVGQGRFEGRSKLSTYLYRIAYFRCVDVLRKAKLPVYFTDQLPESEDLSQRLSEHIERESEMKQLNIFLDHIGQPCQGILMDWGYWGYDMTEIARRNGLESAGQAKSRKYQCLKRLRQLITKEKKRHA